MLLTLEMEMRCLEMRCLEMLYLNLHHYPRATQKHNMMLDLIDNARRRVRRTACSAIQPCCGSIISITLILISVDLISPRTLIRHIAIINIPPCIAGALLKYFRFDRTIVKCQLSRRHNVVGLRVGLSSCLPSSLDPVIENTFDANEPGIVQAGELRHIHVVSVDPTIRIRQHRCRLFWYHESDDIHSDGLVEAEDIDMIQCSISCQLTLEHLFNPPKDLRPLLQHREDLLVRSPKSIQEPCESISPRREIGSRMRRAHEDDSCCGNSNTAETRLVRLQADEKGLFSDQTTEAVGNEEDGTLDLVQSTVGDGICQGLSMPTEAFSTRILPEAYNVGVVAIGDDSRSRKSGTHEVWGKGAIWMRPSRLTVSSQAMDKPDAEGVIS